MNCNVLNSVVKLWLGSGVVEGRVCVSDWMVKRGCKEIVVGIFICVFIVEEWVLVRCIVVMGLGLFCE